MEDGWSDAATAAQVLAQIGATEHLAALEKAAANAEGPDRAVFEDALSIMLTPSRQRSAEGRMVRMLEKKYRSCVSAIDVLW